MPPNEGVASLEALDKVIADKPHKVGHDFSAAMKHLCAYRDRLITERRGGDLTEASRARLTRLNAVISTVMAGHFPLGPVPWQEIEQAREELAGLVGKSPGG